MKISNKMIFGVILVVIGLLLFIDRTGVLTFNFWSSIWTFWPLILVFLGIKLFFENKIPGAIILTTLGTVLFLTNVFDWNFFAILWPLAIIAIGISVLFKEEDFKVNNSSTKGNEEKLDDTAIFWGVEKKNISKDFKGGEVNAIFGGYELDLRESKVSKEGAKLSVNAIFGGVEVSVPKDCRVITNGTGILGGWSSTVKPNDLKTPVLEITGSAIFGGVEIKE